MNVRLVFIGFILFSFTSQGAIFGGDDRVLVTPGSQYELVGRATAVAVLSSLIEPNKNMPNSYDLWVDDLDQMLCLDQKFSNLVSLSYACSGFLIAPDLLVTAGHCMVNVGESINESQMYCEAFGWLFDHQVDAQGKVRTKEIPADRFYRCKRIIYAVLDEKSPYRDYALVQLERPVEANRKPLPISTEPVSIGDSVQMVGYPLGGPMTYSGPAEVKYNVAERQSFITNLDSFEGNSGSVVLNAKNEVVGILVGGTPLESLVRRPQAACYEYNSCDDNGVNCKKPDNVILSSWLYPTAGSEVQRIAPIVELLKNIPH